jgi:hypothetical protein
MNSVVDLATPETGFPGSGEGPAGVATPIRRFLRHQTGGATFRIDFTARNNNNARSSRDQ